MSLIVKITPNDKGNPPGKLADAELHFTHPRTSSAMKSGIESAASDAPGRPRSSERTATSHGHKPVWIWKKKIGPNDKGSTRLLP